MTTPILTRGTHFEDARAGRVFSQSATPLGLALPIYTATAIVGGLPIWNQPGSRMDIEVVRVDLAYGSGTSDFGAVGLMAGPLGSIATASGCSAFAATNPVNANLGRQGGSRAVSSNAGTVTVTAGVATPPVPGVAGAGWIRSLMSMNLEAVSGTAHGLIVASYDFHGSLVVPEGWLIYLASTKASVALFASCIIWKEIDKAAGS